VVARELLQRPAACVSKTAVLHNASLKWFHPENRDILLHAGCERLATQYMHMYWRCLWNVSTPTLVHICRIIIPGPEGVPDRPVAGDCACWIALLIDHLLLHAAVLTPAFEIVVVDGQFEYLAKSVHTTLHIVVCSLTL
jgi:hypothetical protein